MTNKTSSSTKPARKTTDRINTTHKWDVVAAEKEYVEDHTISLSKIAQKYGVNVRTVSRHAKLRDWTKRRQEAINEGLDEHKENHKKLITETNERHLKLYRSAQNAAAAGLKRGHDSKDIKEVTSSIFALKSAIDGERTVLGMPTLIKKEADQDDAATKPINLIEAAERAEELLREAGELN